MTDLAHPGLAVAPLEVKDFTSDQEVRWCPGCGDYAILKTMKKVLPEIGVPPERTVFVSGIGCSSRFPYYLDTYGVHGIHGRAPAIATGLKATRPDLQVWVITGDGDALSIGGNHLMHALRRNLDLTIVLFNNRIYGLTKGQYSPTSPRGHVTTSTPFGSIDAPLDPVTIALACNASFVARSVDVYAQHLATVLKRAAAHHGTAFIEVYQNCNVYNDGAFEYASDKKQRADAIVELEQGRPLRFGAKGDRGVRLNGLRLEAVSLDEVDESELLVHDERADPVVATMLAGMRYPDLPEPIGVLRAVERPCYEDDMQHQIDAAREASGAGELMDLFHSGETWVVD